MQFHARKRRQAPAVIIVALIDILIVLLIFLMVTTTFKQQPALKLALPESSQAKKTGASEPPPLIVNIDPKGLLYLGADAKPVTIERLKEEILAAIAKKPDLQLAISADKSRPHRTGDQGHGHLQGSQPQVRRKPLHQGTRQVLSLRRSTNHPSPSNIEE